MKTAVDPVYYASTPWEFHLVEADIESVREYFDDPKRCSLYANDVHKTPVYGMDRKLWEFSRFVKLRQSSWTVLHLVARFYGRNREPKRNRAESNEALRTLTTKEAAQQIVEDIHKECQRAWDKKKAFLAFLSKEFDTQSILFGYEKIGDNLYYELYEKGFWKESFMGGLYDPNVSTSTTFCTLKSEMRPDCKPGNDEKHFVEETFHMWKIAIPFISITTNDKNPHLIMGCLASGSVFTEDEIKGFDCALIEDLSVHENGEQAW